MLILPAVIIEQFDNFLLKKSFSDKDKAFYKKWLRFYWDFCHKYQHDAFHLDSLPLFIQKLQDKNQSVQQQNQANYSVSLFFEMRAVSDQPLNMNQSINPNKIASNHGTYFRNHTSVVQNSVQLSSSDQPQTT